MWELSRKTYLSIYKVVLLKVSLKRRTDKWIDIMIFSRNQRHTAVFLKYFLGKFIYTTGSLLDWAWRQKPGGISHWYKKLLKRKDSLSFLLFWYSNGSHYHLLHIDTCQCFFSWDSCSGWSIYSDTSYMMI